MHNQPALHGAGNFPENIIVPDRSLTHTKKRNSGMPSQPAWFHRLDEILETLRVMESSHLDRLAVQKLFGVRERRARQLMAGLPGLRAGNAFAVSRQALVARLEETAAGGLFQWEVNRRSRVVEELDRSRRMLAARRVRIPAAADVEERRLRDLSGDIALKPGELRIEFYGAEDLAAKLLELSKAMSNDWPAFMRAVEDGGNEAAASVR
jgi:hypothetical protein